MADLGFLTGKVSIDPSGFASGADMVKRKQREMAGSARTTSKAIREASVQMDQSSRGMRRFGFATQQLGFGLEDFASQYGTMGLAGGIRAASNNLTQFAAIMSPQLGLIASVTAGVTALALSYRNAGKEADKTGSSIEALEKRFKELGKERGQEQGFQERLAGVKNASSAESLVERQKRELEKSRDDLRRREKGLQDLRIRGGREILSNDEQRQLQGLDMRLTLFEKLANLHRNLSFTDTRHDSAIRDKINRRMGEVAAERDALEAKIRKESRLEGDPEAKKAVDEVFRMRRKVVDDERRLLESQKEFEKRRLEERRKLQSKGLFDRDRKIEDRAFETLERVRKQGMNAAAIQIEQIDKQLKVLRKATMEGLMAGSLDKVSQAIIDLEKKRQDIVAKQGANQFREFRRHAPDIAAMGMAMAGGAGIAGFGLFGAQQAMKDAAKLKPERSLAPPAAAIGRGTHAEAEFFARIARGDKDDNILQVANRQLDSEQKQEEKLAIIANGVEELNAEFRDTFRNVKKFDAAGVA